MMPKTLKFCSLSCHLQAVDRIVDKIIPIGCETGKISILGHLAFCASSKDGLQSLKAFKRISQKFTNYWEQMGDF
jgi:hypothetical protein